MFVNVWNVEKLGESKKHFQKKFSKQPKTWIKTNRSDWINRILHNQFREAISVINDTFFVYTCKL